MPYHKDMVNKLRESVGNIVGAYLLEEKDDGLGSLFAASIGNFAASKAALVTIAYVTELDFEDDKLRFVLPVQPFAPRSSESVHTKFMQPVSSDYTQAVPYGLKVQCTYAMSHQVSAIASSSHSVLAELSEFGRRASVQLVHPEVRLPSRQRLYFLKRVDRLATGERLYAQRYAC